MQKGRTTRKLPSAREREGSRELRGPRDRTFKLQVGDSQLQVPRLSTQTCQQYVTEKKRKGAGHQFLQVSQFPSPNGRPSPQLSNGKLRRKSATVPMTRPARGAQAARPGTLHAASDSPGSPGRFLPVDVRRVSGGKRRHNRSQGCLKQTSSGHERASPPGRSDGGGMVCGGRQPRPARDVVVVRAGMENERGSC
ncbi:hypothetical protein AUP68_02002 [Ilyonectria robusta]